MTIVTDIVSEQAIQFMRTFSEKRESPALANLRHAMAGHPRQNMQVSLEQGRLMAQLVQMLGAKRCLEVGVFTGYSALCIAEILPPEGKLVGCDVSEEWTSFGKRFWEEAGVADRIDLRIGPASESLAAMIDNGDAESFDFAFIDANKDGYEDYYEKCFQLIRPGGVIMIDNIFLSGRTFDPLIKDDQDAGAAVVRKLTAKISTDARVDASMAPVGDGIVLVRKR